MKYIYRTMLRSFQPTNEIDAQIYEQVVGLNKDIIEDSYKTIRGNTETILNDVKL